MSGILDNKSRVIDAILTYEGRRQMATGDFKIEYVTFSDRGVFYERSLEEGHTDPTKKISLEAFNSPHDQIVFEADDSGNLIPFRQHESLNIQTVTGSVTSSISWVSFFNGRLTSNTKVYSTSLSFTGSATSEPIKGVNFASQIEGILTSSLDNFKSLMILGSKDELFETQDFAISTNEISFKLAKDSNNLHNSVPTSVNSIDALFSDEKLRNVENFLYLPPIKKTNFRDKSNISALKNAELLLGDYPPWGPTKKLTFPDIKNELKNYEAYSKTLYFDPTSLDNQIFAQFFEVKNDSVSKLDVIDYGKTSDNSENPNVQTHHVFFVGKVVVDDFGSSNFVHLFTMLFESEEVS